MKFDSIEEKQARFEELITPYYQALKAFARQLANRPDQAEDLFQETMLKAYKHFERLDPERGVKSWLFKIMHNAWRDMVKQEKRWAGSIEFIEEIAYRSGERYMESMVSGNLEDEMIDRITAQQIRQEIERLPEKYRVVVTMCDLYEMSYREIAEALDIPLGTVMSRLFRGRNLLRARILGVGCGARREQDEEEGAKGGVASDA